MNDIFVNIENVIDKYYIKRLSLFKKLFGEKVVDVLLHCPSFVIEKFFIKSFDAKFLDCIVSVVLTVKNIEQARLNSNQPSKIQCVLQAQYVEILLFFRQSRYIVNAYRRGDRIVVTGKLSISSCGVWQIISPEKIAKFMTLSYVSSGFFNIYPLTAGLDQKAVYHVVKNALFVMKNMNFPDWQEKNILQQNNWPTFVQAIDTLHNPQGIENKIWNNLVKQRICFDEILAEQIILRLLRSKTSSVAKIDNKKILIQKLQKILPFDFTISQEKAINDILSDMASGRPMARLLHGDVGSGKTIVAIVAALNIIENGGQVAFLVPTEILAKQHYSLVKNFFDQLDLKTEILTSSDKGKKRKETLFNIKNKISHILIGTHSIIMNEIEFDNLCLVVVDEQHKFGVVQRLKLVVKGLAPHILSMTATPIPRTLILASYGDVDVSTIVDKPFGRKEIVTKALSISRLEEIVVALKNILKKNERIYWICSLIEESATTDYTSVLSRAQYLQKYYAEEVGVLHGKMKAAEKAEIFDKFSDGRIRILVSTTVVEVGLDIPDATVMIIENAEKFGLAQLHQLRGRIGRREKQSFCILLHENKISSIARQRIDIMKNNTDGFFIAEQDLLMRGGGELIGTMQSGVKKYHTFDLTDPDAQKIIQHLFIQAASLASDIVRNNKIKQYAVLLKIFSSEDSEKFVQSF